MNLSQLLKIFFNNCQRSTLVTNRNDIERSVISELVPSAAIVNSCNVNYLTLIGVDYCSLVKGEKARSASDIYKSFWALIPWSYLLQRLRLRI